MPLKLDGILMLVSDTDSDTDSNSALRHCLFWKFATWPHLPYCPSYCSRKSLYWELRRKPTAKATDYQRTTATCTSAAGCPSTRAVGVSNWNVRLYLLPSFLMFDYWRLLCMILGWSRAPRFMSLAVELQVWRGPD